jgi:hypothetical protein
MVLFLVPFGTDPGEKLSQVNDVLICEYISSGGQGLPVMFVGL